MALDLDEKSFDDEVLRSEEPVVVDFWAPWCGPCRSMAPIIEELTQEYAGKVKIAKVNVDENRSLAMRYRVMSIPTMMMFKDGAEKDKIVGYVDKGVISKKIDELL